jgi:hypothetical protein
MPARNRPPGVRPKARAAACAAILRRPRPPARKPASRPLGTAPEPEPFHGRPDDNRPAAQGAFRVPRHGRPAQGRGCKPPPPRVVSGVAHRGTKPGQAMLPAANRGDVNAGGLGSLPQGGAVVAGCQGLFQAVITCGHCSPPKMRAPGARVSDGNRAHGGPSRGHIAPSGSCAPGVPGRANHRATQTAQGDCGYFTGPQVRRPFPPAGGVRDDAGDGGTV